MHDTGHAGRHLSHPLHSSGTMITSTPWLKIAPNCGGQWGRQASQLMHSAIWMRSGALRHFGFRARPGMASDLPVQSPVVSGRAEEDRVASKHPFLSEDWFTAVAGLIEQHGN